MTVVADLHIHTNLSSCSSFTVEEAVRLVRARGLRFATVTDHGDGSACAILREALPGVVVVFGVEVTTQEGDFLVYSLDEAYVRGLGVYAGSVTELRRDADTALVWAHPRVPQAEDWAESSTPGPEIDRVLTRVDALELFNGMMLHLADQGLVRPPYFANLRALAARHGVALTGGSDAHEPENFFAAWTEFEDGVETAGDFIRAIKARRVRPDYDRARHAVRVDPPLGPDSAGRAGERG